MTVRDLLICVTVLGVASAQTPTATSPTLNRSVSGAVKARGTGTPLADYEVSTDITITSTENGVTSSTSKEVKTTTDKNGSYQLSDLPPGQYRIGVRHPQHFGTQLSKRVTLAGQDLEHLDFSLAVDAAVSGRVIDENKEPVPGLSVFLVSKEYYLGEVGYFVKATGRTNDRGEYTIARGLEAGRSYLVLAEKRALSLPAHSEVPINPNLRRRVPMRTWYPNSPGSDGAAAVTLRSGERREGVDIEVRKSPSYCVDGSIQTPTGGTAMRFSIEPQTASSGTSSTGGTFMAAPAATTAPDGKFRICDLYPGNYRLTVNQPILGAAQLPQTFGIATISVSDRDIHDFKVMAVPGIPMAGEVVLDGGEPATPITVKASVVLRSLKRAPYSGEESSARVDVPGAFSFPGLFLDDYSVRTMVNSPGLYIKDVEYGGHSVMYQSIRPGSSLGETGLRVTIGQDGAKVGVRVVDKDGNPVPDMRIAIMPAEIRSEGMLASKLVSGLSDQAGQYTSGTLAPGKYYVAASGESVDATVDSIEKVWRSRTRFKEIDLAPSRTTQVTLEPVKIE